jgi:Transposase DNA-binding
LGQRGNHSCFFEDFRHGKRLRETLSILSKYAGESIPQSTQSTPKSQSIYRFWANERVNASQILAGHRPRVLKQQLSGFGDPRHNRLRLLIFKENNRFRIYLSGHSAGH